jgi:hypothetical protein
METWAMASVGDLGVRRGFVDSVRFFTLRSLDPLTVLNSFFGHSGESLNPRTSDL